MAGAESHLVKFMVKSMKMVKIAQTETQPVRSLDCDQVPKKIVKMDTCSICIIDR